MNGYQNMSRIQLEHLFTVSSKWVEKPVPLPRPRKSLASRKYLLSSRYKKLLYSTTKISSTEKGEFTRKKWYKMDH